MNSIKQNRLSIGFILLSLSLLSGAVWAEPIDGIIATVNNSVITKSELQNSISVVKKQISENKMAEPSEGELNKQVLDQMINRKLQLQLAEQSGIKVTDDDVDNAINHIAQENKITPSEIYQKLISEGMTETEYRKNLKEEITLRKLQQQEVASKITINPQEVDDFMRTKASQASNTKEYHLEDILVSVPDEPTTDQIAQAKDQANAILKKIHQGMSFDQASSSDSNHASTQQGGDLGWRKVTEIPSVFAQQVTRMKQNDVIGPVQAPNGFHIVHLAGIRNVNAEGSNIAMERNEAEQLIFQHKLEANLQSWIMKLRSGASINVNLQA